MKKNLALGFLCTLGIADGALATEWKTFDPNNSTLFNVTVHNSGAACNPVNVWKSELGTPTDMVLFNDIRYPNEEAVYYYKCDSGSCPDATKVAIAGDSNPKRFMETFEGGTVKHGTNKIWKCETEAIGYDEWWSAGNLSECQDPAYTKLKNTTNAIPVLVSPSKGRQTFSYTYVNPPNDVCIAYVCNPNTSIATMNPFTSSTRELQNSQYECMAINPACSFKYGDKSIRMPTGYQYIGTLKSSLYTKAKFPQLKSKMDETVERNQILVDELYEKVSTSHNIFERKSDTTGTYISIKDNVLDNLNFYIRCEASGLAFAPATCPTYFKLQNEDCVLDTNSIRSAIDNKDEADRNAAAVAAAQHRAECARALCTASGGQYSPINGDCTCGGGPCSTINNTGGIFMHGGYVYYYCTSFRGNGCHNGLWSVNKRVPTPAEIASWESNLTECIDAADAAADSTAANTDTISTLAGRLALVEDQFGLSKWRTADGKFNTARLASDLTAGVVLGTTGALVTSSVVKKKQVKDGFESLECTVGGQHVGDWGDVFRIDGK